MTAYDTVLEIVGKPPPCQEGIAFLKKYEDLAVAWSHAPKGSWLAWYLTYTTTREHLAIALNDCITIARDYEIRNSMHYNLAVQGLNSPNICGETIILWLHSAVGFHDNYLERCAQVLRLWYPSPPLKRV